MLTLYALQNIEIKTSDVIFQVNFYLNLHAGYFLLFDKYDLLSIGAVLLIGRGFLE